MERGLEKDMYILGGSKDEESQCMKKWKGRDLEN